MKADATNTTVWLPYETLDSRHSSLDLLMIKKKNRILPDLSFKQV